MIDKLEFFMALARTRHFGKAAEELGITQPTLSAGIKQLEDQLGVMLVLRGSRFQALTPEGEQVLVWARRITNDTRTMREEMHAARRGLSGRLRIAAIPTALAMTPLLTQLKCCRCWAISTLMPASPISTMNRWAGCCRCRFMPSAISSSRRQARRFRSASRSPGRKSPNGRCAC